jgi:hypothetical protein
MNLDLAAFDSDLSNESKAAPSSPRLGPSLAQTSPYNAQTVPRDVLNFLPPSGNPFSLFGDPYAQLTYVKTEFNVIRTCKYWLKGKQEDNNFSDHEIALFTFLMRHRVATRYQINQIVFGGKATDYKVKEFLRKCIKNGVLIAFKWVSPCPSERKLPQLYGLSTVAADGGAEVIGTYPLPRMFKFLPQQFVPGQAPSMNPYFREVIANQFYCKLHELDRVVEWTNRQSYYLSNGSEFKPNYLAKVIKDENEFKYFWLEVVRPQYNWYNHTIERFNKIQMAYNIIDKVDRPEVIVLLVDDISRIPDLAALAEQLMPDVPLRFTTDERLMQKEEEAIFYSCHDNVITPGIPSYLKKTWQGMSASQYLEVIYAAPELDFDDD